VVAPPRAELDLAYPADVREAVRVMRPGLVVNCAAYTDVEGAEDDAELARLLNAEAPGVLAEEAARIGAVMIHLSTDYVFDGAKRTPYTEDDPAAPLNVYGRTKREGERAVEAAGGSHLVLRTGWVYGFRGRNFLRTILRLATEREELRVVADQAGAPTWSRLVAEGVTAVIAAVAGGGAAREGGPWGTYHLSAGGVTTWCGFAEAILAACPPAGGSPRIVPVSSAEFGSRARRPAYSVLDGGRIDAAFGVRLPHWRDQLALATAE
jgi:dTDP-4-dehydrorhamnose reductase